MDQQQIEFKDIQGITGYEIIKNQEGRFQARLFSKVNGTKQPGIIESCWMGSADLAREWMQNYVRQYAKYLFSAVKGN